VCLLQPALHALPEFETFQTLINTNVVSGAHFWNIQVGKALLATIHLRLGYNVVFDPVGHTSGSRTYVRSVVHRRATGEQLDVATSSNGQG
jgi:hypothetical protein